MTAQAGVCRFCGVDDAQVDGDRLRWLGPSRTCCSKPACVRAHYAEMDRAKFKAARSVRKRTPAEIHAIKLEEKREQRRRYRENAAARKRGAA